MFIYIKDGVKTSIKWKKYERCSGIFLKIIQQNFVKWNISDT